MVFVNYQAWGMNIIFVKFKIAKIVFRVKILISSRNLSSIIKYISNQDIYVFALGYNENKLISVEN